MTRRRDVPTPIARALELTIKRGVITCPELAPRLRLSLFDTYRTMMQLARDGFVQQIDTLTFRVVDSTNGDQ